MGRLAVDEGERGRPRARRGIYLAPFEELSDPMLLAELGERAEARGWEGVFLWDHISHRAPVRVISDPWVALAAIAMRTRSVRLGPLVTPLSRRRVQKLARETVTLDRLSGGRLTLGVGLGADDTGELEPWGEVSEPRERARLLDERLQRLAPLGGGEFVPRPVQRPRIPVWVAARWPSRRPVRRAARWDGLFPIELPGPQALEELARELDSERPAGAGRGELVVDIAPGEDPEPWERAGATWLLTGFGAQPRRALVEEVIDAGP